MPMRKRKMAVIRKMSFLRFFPDVTVLAEIRMIEAFFFSKMRENSAPRVTSYVNKVVKLLAMYTAT